jgi:hypothetical protein
MITYTLMADRARRMPSSSVKVTETTTWGSGVSEPQMIQWAALRPVQELTRPSPGGQPGRIWSSGTSL